MVVRRDTYPQVDPRAAGLMTAAVTVVSGRVTVGEAARLAHPRGGGNGRRGPRRDLARWGTRPRSPSRPTDHARRPRPGRGGRRRLRRPAARRTAGGTSQGAPVIPHRDRRAVGRTADRPRDGAARAIRPPRGAPPGRGGVPPRGPLATRFRRQRLGRAPATRGAGGAPRSDRRPRRPRSERDPDPPPPGVRGGPDPDLP